MLGRSLQSLASLAVMAVGKTVFILLISFLYGPIGLGIVTLGISVGVLGGLVMGSGTEFSNAHLAGRYSEWLTPLRRNSLRYLGITLPSSIILVGLGWSLFRETVFESLPQLALPALLLMIPLQVLHLQVQGILIGLGRFSAVGWANLIQYGLVNAGLVGAGLVEAPAVWVLYIWLAGLLAKTIFSVQALPLTASTADDRFVFRRQVRIGREMLLGELARLANFRLDALLIAYFLTAGHVGLYSLAATLAEGTLYLHKAFGQVLLSFVSLEGAQGPNRRRVRDVFLIAVLTAAALVVLLQIILNPMIQLLFGPSFEGSIASARVLLVAAFFSGIGLLSMFVLFGSDRAGLNTRASVVAAAVNLGANLVAIPRWGLLGAAAASLLSYFLYCALNVRNVRALLEISAFHLVVPGKSDVRRGIQASWRSTSRIFSRG